MPRLSELLKNQVSLPVPYRGAVITVVYKPESVNPDVNAAIQARVDKKEIEARHSDAAFLAEVITSWDLNDDNDAPYPVTFEVMKARSTSLQLALIAAIYDDQRNPQNPPQGN